MYTTLVAGHICLDLTPALPEQVTVEPGELIEVGPLTVRPGGCVANTGGDLSALGAPVRLAADVGSDVLGETLLAVLRERGLDTTELRRTDHATSYSVVVQAPGRDRMFWHHVGANRHFDGRSVHLDGCDLLHVGYPSILPALIAEHGRRLSQLLTRARNVRTTTSLDLAVVDHSAGLGDAGAVHRTWRELFGAILPLVDIISPSVADIESATGYEVSATPDSVLGVADWLVENGAGIAMVSAGTSGMALATGSARRLSQGGRVLRALAPAWADVRTWHAVTPVLDPVTTTGAGDAATAGLLYAVLRSAAPDRALALAASTARARVLGERPGASVSQA